MNNNRAIALARAVACPGVAAALAAGSSKETPPRRPAPNVGALTAEPRDITCTPNFFA